MLWGGGAWASVVLMMVTSALTGQVPGSKHATLPASSDEASLTEACAERAGGKAEVNGMRAKPHNSTCPWLQTLQG